MASVVSRRVQESGWHLIERGARTLGPPRFDLLHSFRPCLCLLLEVLLSFRLLFWALRGFRPRFYLIKRQGVVGQPSQWGSPQSTGGEHHADADDGIMKQIDGNRRLLRWELGMQDRKFGRGHDRRESKGRRRQTTNANDGKETVAFSLGKEREVEMGIYKL